MRRLHLILGTLFLSVYMSACASGRIQVTSSPVEAEVFVSRDGRAPEKIGATPLYLSSSELSAGAQKFVQIEVRKEGFAPESILVPNSLFGSNVDLSMKLHDLADSSKMCTESHAALHSVARGIARSQMLIGQRSYERAEATLQALIVEFPQISIFHDLLGNVYYLQKDLKKALVSYQEALRLDPENIETDRMVRRLRSMDAGGRLPSSGGL